MRLIQDHQGPLWEPANPLLEEEAAEIEERDLVVMALLQLLPVWAEVLFGLERQADCKPEWACFCIERGQPRVHAVTEDALALAGAGGVGAVVAGLSGFVGAWIVGAAFQDFDVGGREIPFVLVLKDSLAR